MEIRDYAHAARLQAAWEGPLYDTSPSAETEQLYALKVAIEACGYDIPDALFDDLEASIDEDVANICYDNRVSDAEDSLREEVECNLRHGATLEWALKLLPGMAADHAEKTLRNRALYWIGRFAASLLTPAQVLLGKTAGDVMVSL
jgi:hypothetical protein